MYLEVLGAPQGHLSSDPVITNVPIRLPQSGLVSSDGVAHFDTQVANMVAEHVIEETHFTRKVRGTQASESDKRSQPCFVAKFAWVRCLDEEIIP